jgi:hypothetical protein
MVNGGMRLCRGNAGRAAPAHPILSVFSVFSVAQQGLYPGTRVQM